MAEYIEREVAVENVMAAKWIDGYDGAMAMEIVAAAPAADVALVVHARWIYKHRHRGGIRIHEGKDEMGETRRISVDERYEIDDPYCSSCGKLNESVWLNYCPNCGAKMDGGDGNEAD